MNTRAVGTLYEMKACAYLEEKGYKIVERNYRNRFGEIDIIATNASASMWIFCEVKYRSGKQYGEPLEAVDGKKQRRICKSALYFYTYDGYAQQKACRFDVIAIYGDGRIEHIENAFAYHG